MPLRTELCCEIDNLIAEVVIKSGKTYDEVETAMFKLYLYPESSKTYITSMFGPVVDEPKYEWLNDALTSILKEVDAHGIYITNAI